jgi:formate hydrogenlyase transcriptional activator
MPTFNCEVPDYLQFALSERVKATSVAIATSGPGVSNLITGLATANTEDDPIVALGGAVPLADRLKKIHQSMDSVSLMRAVTKYSVEVDSSESVAVNPRMIVQSRSHHDHGAHLESSEQVRAELQREKDHLRLLFDLNNRIASNLNLHDLLRAVSASVGQIMLCDAVVIHLPKPEDSQLGIFAFAHPFSDELLTAEDLDALGTYERLYTAEAFRTRRPVIVDPSENDHQCSDAKCIVREDVGNARRSICALPLISHDRVLGVLEVVRWRNPEFSQRDIDFMVQVANQIAIAVENALAFQEIKELRIQLSRERIYLEDELRCEKGFEEIVGHSAAIRSVLCKIETVAPTDSTVLINGETGTGKELVARAIHERSGRHAQAFVKLNCAAIPTGLLESELFGHERGAFTGAITQRIGRFELANRGTAFLDEIGEISLELQPKLLRVLQEREIERLGSARTLKTDARLIAATNQDLAECVEAQAFRADLLYRLNVFPIYVPPLRERPEDIPLLVRHFVMFYARRMNRSIDTIPSEAMESLIRYPWPGNIRELQNLIEHSVILTVGPTLRVPLANLTGQSKPRLEAASNRTLLEAERDHILATLKATRWIISGPRGAAIRLGMNRSTLQFRMKKLGIIRPGS